MIAALAACSPFDGSPDPGDAGAPDAVTDASGGGGNEGGGGGHRCTPGAPFGTPSLLAGLSAYSVEAVRFGFNRQVVYLSLCPSDGTKSGCDLFQGVVTGQDTFASFSPLAHVNAAGYDSYATVTGNADLLLFASSRVSPVRLYYAPAVDGQFKTPQELDTGISPYASNEPYLLADGRTFYFGATVSNNPQNWELYRATGRPPDFKGATLVPGLGDPANDFAPVPAEDELEIFFASARAPSQALDLWAARRSSVDEPFGAPVHLAALSGADNDYPTWISPDACELYFISKTGEVARAYVARRGG